MPFGIEIISQQECYRFVSPQGKSGHFFNVGNIKNFVL